MEKEKDTIYTETENIRAKFCLKLSLSTEGYCELFPIIFFKNSLGGISPIWLVLAALSSCIINIIKLQKGPILYKIY